MNESRLEKIKHWYHDLPDKKKYLEFISAFLTIPVMVTVLITNTINLQNQHKTAVATPAPTIIIQAAPQKLAANVPDITKNTDSAATPTPQASPSPVTQSAASSPQPTPAAVQCKKGVGPVDISSPQENEVVSANPVCIDISRGSEDYCSIVWSYSINNGPWSDYLDKSICLYGLTPGPKQLQLKIRSVVDNTETTLTRNFTVAGTTATPTASSSASN